MSENECTCTGDHLDADGHRNTWQARNDAEDKLRQLDSMMFGATLWGTEIDMEKDMRDRYFMLAERLIKEVRELVDVIYEATLTPERKKRRDESLARMERIIGEREAQL